MSPKGSVVAVVDDDEAVLDALRLFLDLLGFPAATYNSPLAFLRDTNCRPRCLVLDHHMPEMTGLDLAAQLRKAGNAIPIMLITAGMSPAILARAASIGIDVVLEKPPSENDLLNFVASAPVCV